MPPVFRIRRSFGNFDASLENFRTFAVGKDKGCEFCLKISERGPPTLEVPRRPCSEPQYSENFWF